MKRTFAPACVSLALLVSACGQTPTPLAGTTATSLAAQGKPATPRGGNCFSIPEGDPEHLPIFKVQGDGAASPYEGQAVTVRGIVTADLQSTLGGFFIQSQTPGGNATTSDGIYVYTGRQALPVAAGDLVQLAGTVDEYFGATQIENVTRFTKCSGGHVIEPTTVTFPENDWERYEGMLVTTQGVVTELFKLGRGGSVTIADERIYTYTQLNEPTATGYAEHLQDLKRRTLVIDDGSLRQNPDPIRFARDGQPLSATNTLRGGDTASVTGVLTYSFDGWGGSSTNAYRVHATSATFDGPARPAAPTRADLGSPTLNVAAMNVLNFFNGNGDGSGFPTSRGADTTAEFERQTAKIVSAIEGLDADVIGLMEIENDFGSDAPAIERLVGALNAKLGEGTYAYVDPVGKVGTDEIAVALIYRPAAVAPAGPLARLDSTFDPAYDDTKNRVTIAQTFRDKATGGVFTAAVAHLKSKGSSCGPGDDDTTTGQGNCNVTRTKAAEVMVDWLKTNPTGIADADVIIMGDLNAYAMEDPIDAVKAGADGNGGTADDFINLFPATSYSYVFNGQWGSLDHALTTSNLKSQVSGAAKWHINADEPPVLDYNVEFKSDAQDISLYAPNAYRSSDHDPLVIGLNLNTDPAPVFAPVFRIDAPATVTAGTAYSLTVGNLTLSEGATVREVEVNWGDGTFVTVPETDGAYTATLAQAPAEDFTVTVRVTDSNGKVTTKSQAVNVIPVAAAQELFFSEYIEGSSNNKALEIYNPTGAPVDLSAYTVKLFNNGATVPNSTQPLTGSLAAGDAYVIVNSGASAGLAALKDITSAVTSFNGNDVVALYMNDQLIDVIGQIGHDPGAAWTANDVSTANMTLRRKPSITAGDPNGTDAFEPSVQWNGFDIDTFGGLGSHSTN